MAAITVLIFAEKSLSLGHRIRQLGALALIVYGLLAVFVPEVLTTMVRQGHMGM
jgi:predicted metal-binding membrane protein